MRVLTLIAALYGFGFIFSLVSEITWLTIAVGLLGVFLFVCLAVKIENVDADTATYEQFLALQKEVDELKEKKSKS